jgi:hypothetical protein
MLSILKTQAHWHGRRSTDIGGTETTIPPDGPSSVHLNDPSRPSIETVVFDVEATAPSVRMLSFGHAKDIAYTVVPESDFLDVYLQQNAEVDVIASR